MKNYVQPGSPLTITAAADVTSGDLVKVGDLIGVAAGDAATGEAVVVEVVGVYQVPKLSSDDIAVGDALYFDAAEGHLTKSADGNTFAGVAAADAGIATTTVEALFGYPPRTAAVTCQPAKHYLDIGIADADETTPAYTVAPAAGTISKVRTVVQPDPTLSATVASATVITVDIGGTPVTGGAVTIPLGATVGSTQTAIPSGDNVVAAGDVIGAASDGADTNNHPVKVQVEITPA